MSRFWLNISKFCVTSEQVKILRYKHEILTITFLYQWHKQTSTDHMQYEGELKESSPQG